MDLEFREVGTLPRLAWLAIVREGEPTVEVVHGPWVETSARFFIEGAWDGPFTEGAFADSLMLMGSGGIVNEDGVLFCAAAHPLESLYLLRDGGSLYVSPSLVFLLRASGSRLDVNYIPYQADFLRFQQGLANHVGEIALAEGRKATAVRFRNVRVDPLLEVRILPKPESPRFRDFADYKAFLVEGLKAFRDNAAAPERRVRYEPTTTVSSGYDSAACAALSLEIGCQDSVTVVSARQTGQDGGEKDDRGTAVAEALGLTVREYDRNAFRSNDGFPEAEFVACGDLGQNLPMVAMASAFTKRFVLTGEHGDTVWDRRWDVGKDKQGVRDIVRRSCDGCSLVEFRLRVGFIHLPLPAVGAQSLPDLKRISVSEEMAPWTLHTSYDRPIARRLVEEMGVHRSLFGQDKKAITVLLNQDQLLEPLMKPESYESFAAFYRDHACERDPRQQRLHGLMYRLYRVYFRLFWRVNKGLWRLGIPWTVPCPVPARFRHPPGQPSFLFHWGVAQIIDRYADAFVSTRRRPT